MSFKTNAFPLIFTTALFLTACSGAQDQITPFPSESTFDENEDSGDYVANLYAYISPTSLSVGSFTYVITEGGTPPYTYSTASAQVSVNSSSGYLQALGTGSATVQVRDASGSNFNLQVQVVEPEDPNASNPCIHLSSKSALSSGSVESRIDLTAHTQLNHHVVIGLGLRFHEDALTGIFSKVAKLKADGSISKLSGEVFNYQNGNLGSTEKGEIYIDLPEGFFLTGVGLATDAGGNNPEALKLYGSKVDSRGAVTSSLECLVDKDTKVCSFSNISVLSKPYYSRYFELRSTHTKPIVTWGVNIRSGKVTSSDIANKTITASTIGSGLCPQ